MPDDLKPAERQLLRELERIRRTPVRIALVGRTGAGKSSTVNRLIGAEVAEVGNFEPVTPTVEHYTGTIDGFSYEVYDTPGLCDDLPNRGNDGRYIELMQSRITPPDLWLYVARLPDNRFEPSSLLKFTPFWHAS